MQYYPGFREFYQRMQRRGNEPIARTLVAREFARIIYYMPIELLT
jgi:hypothetical protein